MAATLDRDLALRLDVIRRDHGDSVKIDEVALVVRGLLDTVDGDISAGDLRLYRELEGLADYIHSAKAEIVQLRPAEIKTEFIASATDELDAIIGATEGATNIILDSAEQIEHLGTMMEPDVAERLTEITTRIFEACNFQDITGQRISKVVKVLKEIEVRVETLVRVFGQEADLHAPRKTPKEVSSDEDLLHGPQLATDAHDQSEIDRLLASFD